jgi:hypothetical protein
MLRYSSEPEIGLRMKIPKHSGPDGQGLPIVAFEKLLSTLDSMTPTDAKGAIELCLTASTQQQWNEEYRLKLIEKYNNLDKANI